MKLIKLLPILVLLTVSSCQKSNFQVGDCIQKPDEIFIYEIISVQDNTAELKPINGGKTASTDLSESMWTRSSCN